VRRVERLQHLDEVEDLPQGVHAKVPSKDLRIVRKLGRSRPSTSWKDKCRERPVEDLEEASQVGERTNTSRGEDTSVFRESSQGRTDG
jgi:hypothetical protein